MTNPRRPLRLTPGRALVMAAVCIVADVLVFSRTDAWVGVALIPVFLVFIAAAALNAGLDDGIAAALGRLRTAWRDPSSIDLGLDR